MPGKTVYVPQFGSQLGSSQIDEPQVKQSNLSACNVARAQMAKRGKKRARGEKTQSVLKVKVPTVSNHTAKNGDTAPRRWTSEPTTTKSKSTVGRGEPYAVTDSDSVGEDVFLFSQRPNSTATEEKGKARLAVLRTISKMLEENQLIRNRLASLSQAT